MVASFLLAVFLSASPLAKIPRGFAASKAVALVRVEIIPR